MNRRDAEAAAAAAQKEARKAHSMELQREKLTVNKKATAFCAEEKRRQQMQQSLQDLQRKLGAPDVSEDQKTKFLAKIEKIRVALNL